MSNEEVAPLMSVAGPAGRTRWDENGSLQTVGEGEIVEEYDPRTGRYRGTRYEQSTQVFVFKTDDLSRWSAEGGCSIPAATNNPFLWSVTNTAQAEGARVFARSKLSGFSHDPVVFSAVFESTGAEYAAVSLQPPAYYAYPDTGRTASFAVDFKNGKVTAESGNVQIGNGTQWIGPREVYLEVVRTNVATSYDGFDVEIAPSNIYADHARRTRGNSDGSTSMRFGLVQIEPGDTRSSFTPNPNESTISARARDDGRFTDPSIFGNFERGTFALEFESRIAPSDSYILSRGPYGRFLYYNGHNLRSYDGGNVIQQSMPSGSLNELHIYAVTWGDAEIATSVDGGPVEKKPFNGTWGGGDLIIGERDWSGWIRRMPFNAEKLSGGQLQRLTAAPRRTAVPNGTILGDYDPNARLSLFKDRHGIHPVEQDGDPVRFMLDLGPQGNHLQAAPESTGLIYRTDGQRSWIEYNGVNDYFQYRAGPVLRGDISMSLHAAFWKDASESTHRTIAAQGAPNSGQEFELLIRGSDAYPVIAKDTRVAPGYIRITDPFQVWKLLRVENFGGEFIFSSDDGIVKSEAEPAGSFAKGSQFRIGYNGYQDRFWKGRLGRITLTADADQADRDALDAEIIDRYVSA